jgi:hypothetical protein
MESCSPTTRRGKYATPKMRDSTEGIRKGMPQKTIEKKDKNVTVHLVSRTISSCGGG